MLEGKMFLPDTGTPMRKIERIRTLLADWLPDPFTVATWIWKSLTIETTGTATAVVSVSAATGAPAAAEASAGGTTCSWVPDSLLDVFSSMLKPSRILREIAAPTREA